MKIKDLRQKTDAELVKECVELREAMFSRRYKAEIEQVASPALRQMKRDIARVKTILRQRGLKSEA